jgi:hypothetical protein
MMIRKLKTSFYVITLVSLAAGCSSQSGIWKPDTKPKVFSIATRQLPPEATYSRLRWVRPEQVLPNAESESDELTPHIFPISHFSVKDSRLDESILVFAALNRYKSQCASSIAGKKITLDIIGNEHEIASAIEQQAGIKVHIDHDRKLIRFTE